jgi:hypothetical protein
MLTREAQLEAAWAELKRSYSLSPYEAADVAWVAIIKLANLLPGASEHKRLLALVDRLPTERVRTILALEGVDVLLNLDPPLESVPSMAHERLDPTRTAQELAVVRKHRVNDSKVALVNLAEVLKRVRNRRAHAFKTTSGPRDYEILSAAATILQALGQAAAEAVQA